MRIAWSKKVTNDFLARVLMICENLSIEPDYLMSCMAFESAETFSPRIKNAAGSGATGLIQFMPRTARGLGTTVDELSKMTAVKQLDFVEKYFNPYKGRLKMLSDVYMAILLPTAVCKPENHILFNSGKAYRQNSGLDSNKDGQITKAEATSKVYDKYIKGLRTDYVREYNPQLEFITDEIKDDLADGRIDNIPEPRGFDFPLKIHYS